jgi:hypothetical protein
MSAARTVQGNPSACRWFAIEYPGAPRLVILGGENAQTAVEALVTRRAEHETASGL